jgi:hypothetical protein
VIGEGDRVGGGDASLEWRLLPWVSTSTALEDMDSPMIDKASDESASLEPIAVEEPARESHWTASESAFFGAGEALETVPATRESFDDLEPVVARRRIARGTGAGGLLSRILRR